MWKITSSRRRATPCLSLAILLPYSRNSLPCTLVCVVMVARVWIWNGYGMVMVWCGGGRCIADASNTIQTRRAKLLSIKKPPQASPRFTGSLNDSTVPAKRFWPSVHPDPGSKLPGGTGHLGGGAAGREYAQSTSPSIIRPRKSSNALVLQYCVV